MDNTGSIEAPDETRNLAEIAENWCESDKAKRFNTPADPSADIKWCQVTPTRSGKQRPLAEVLD